MKNILVVFFCLFVGLLSAQSFPELIAEYEKECSQLVPDTTTQVGVVTHYLVPVKDKLGKITHYVEGSVDTVWQEPYCKEYKYWEYLFNYAIYADSTTFYTWESRVITTYSDQPNIVEVHTKDGRSVTINLDKSKMSYRSLIERPHYCMIKLRKVEPFSEHFWNWIKNK